MNQQEQERVNILARRIIQHENMQNEPYCWHGKPEDAEVITRYPNLLAAIAYGGIWLSNIAKAANISKDIMEAVINDGEELSYNELYEITRTFNRSQRPKEFYFSVDFIALPTLSMMNPETNKYRYRRYMLEKWTDECDEAGAAILPHTVEDTRAVIAKMRELQPIPYAEYRMAAERVLGDVQMHRCNAERKAIIRSTRRLPGSYESATIGPKEKASWEDMRRDELMVGILGMIPSAGTELLRGLYGLLVASQPKKITA